MNGFCSSGKRPFDSEELAKEALVDIRARNRWTDDQGPNGIYLCDSCGCYHFTSKSQEPEETLSEDLKKRIQREKQAQFWINKLNKRS
jgi:hypothetical protein